MGRSHFQMSAYDALMEAFKKLKESLLMRTADVLSLVPSLSLYIDPCVCVLVAMYTTLSLSRWETSHRRSRVHKKGHFHIFIFVSCFCWSITSGIYQFFAARTTSSQSKHLSLGCGCFTPLVLLTNLICCYNHIKHCSICLLSTALQLQIRISIAFNWEKKKCCNQVCVSLCGSEQ